MTTVPDLERRLAANLDAIMAELVAPPTSRFERFLVAARVPEPTARLMAATPMLRWAWFAAVGIVLVLASSAGDASWDQRDRLALLLALAPVVPVISVALAYGAHADRAFEVAVAAPLSGLRLLLLRSMTVVAAAAVLTFIAVLTSPTEGLLRLAWLAPSLATTSLTLAIGARSGLPRAATWVGVSWLALVVLIAQVTDDAVAPFRWTGQAAATAVFVVSSVIVVRTRTRWDRWSDT